MNINQSGRHDYIEVFYEGDSIKKIVYSGSNIGKNKKVYNYRKEIVGNGISNESVDFTFQLPESFFEETPIRFYISDTTIFLKRTNMNNTSSSLSYQYLADIKGNYLKLTRISSLSLSRADYFTFIKVSDFPKADTFTD